MGIVTVDARGSTFENRMSGAQPNRCANVGMALETDLRLRDAVQGLVVAGVNVVTPGAADVLVLVDATHPQGVIAALVTAETGCVPVRWRAGCFRTKTD